MQNTAILIPSCDAFADVHQPFLKCFEKFWPDAPWPMYGMSESGWGPNPVALGHDAGWVDNLLFALHQNDAERILMFLDDMLLCGTVDTPLIVRMADLIGQRSIGAMRLGPCPASCGEPMEMPDDNVGSRKRKRANTENDDPKIAAIPRSEKYRVSTSPTIWNSEYLQTILKAEGVNSPWQFELAGTHFAQGLPQEVYKVHGGSYPMHVLYTAITRGEWEKGAIDWLGRVGIEVADRSRKMRKDSVGTGWPE